MIRRVYPDVADTTITGSYAAPLSSHPGRTWVGLCMVASIDGSTVVDGRSSGLSSANDTAVLSSLRSFADVILVGASTVRGEGYGPPKTPGQRVGVITASGSIDTTMPLFASGAGFIITIESTAIAGEADGDVDVLRAGTDTIDLAAAIRRLGEVHRTPDIVQAEGGAMFNSALLDADLLDEINLTTSPLCVGGDGPRLVSGAGDHARRFELAQMVIDDESFVFTRWRRRP